MFLQCRFDPDLPCAHRHTSATSSPRDVDKDRERKWILQNIQVAKWPSAHQLQSVPADWQTDRQTVRQTDRQVPVSTGNTTLIQPTGGATASSCWSHKLFVQAIVWFQATLIRQCINQSLCFLFAQWPSPECKKVAVVTRCDGALREPVQSAEGLGDEVQESSAGVSPVLPVGGTVLWDRERDGTFTQLLHLRTNFTPLQLLCLFNYLSY